MGDVPRSRSRRIAVALMCVAWGAWLSVGCFELSDASSEKRDSGSASGGKTSDALAGDGFPNYGGTLNDAASGGTAPIDSGGVTGGGTSGASSGGTGGFILSGGGVSPSGGVGGTSPSGGAGGTTPSGGTGGCTPQTCQGKCGAVDDGCGNPLSCPGCDMKSVCVNGTCAPAAYQSCDLGGCPYPTWSSLVGNTAEECGCAASGYLCWDPSYATYAGVGKACPAGYHVAATTKACGSPETHHICVKD